jgi:hypothetical protein
MFLEFECSGKGSILCTNAKFQKIFLGYPPVQTPIFQVLPQKSKFSPLFFSPTHYYDSIYIFYYCNFSQNHKEICRQQCKLHQKKLYNIDNCVQVVNYAARGIIYNFNRLIVQTTTYLCYCHCQSKTTVCSYFIEWNTVACFPPPRAPLPLLFAKNAHIIFFSF